VFINNKYLLYLKYLNKIEFQVNSSDCGVACLKTIANICHIDSSYDIIKNLTKTQKRGTTLYNIKTACEDLGLSAEGYQIDSNFVLSKRQYIISQVLDDNNRLHFVLILDKTKNNILILFDPLKGICFVKEKIFITQLSNKIILLVSNVKNKKNRSNNLKIVNDIYKRLLENQKYVIFNLIIGILIGVNILIISSLIRSISFVNLLIVFLFSLFYYSYSGIVGYLNFKLTTHQEKIHYTHFISNLFNKGIFDRLNYNNGDILSKLSTVRKIESNKIILFFDIITKLSSIVFVVIIYLIFNRYFLISLILLIVPFYFIIKDYFNNVLIQFSKKIYFINLNFKGKEYESIQNFESIVLFKKSFIFIKNLIDNLNYQIAEEIRFNYLSRIYSALPKLFYLIIFGVIYFLSHNINEFVQNIIISLFLFNYFDAIFNVYFKYKELDAISHYNNSIIEKNQLNTVGEFNVELKLNKLEITQKQNNFSNYNFEKFTIEKNLIYRVDGKNGIGKSTFLKKLVTILNFNQTDTLKTNWPTISYISNSAEIFENTLYFNIFFETKFNKEKIQLLIANPVYKKLEISLKNNFTEFIGSSERILSTSQNSMIGLLRGVYSNSDILILDEIFSNFDSETLFLTTKLINELKSDRSIIVVDHSNFNGIIYDKVICLK
jgi:ABC-type bacteriocin/lantibiotic exporter with double-glycine peptidase domain